MDAADSDLKYLLSEVGVAEEVGFTSLRLFSGIDESRAEVRAAITAEVGVDHTASNQERFASGNILKILAEQGTAPLRAYGS